jgi:hypothetical protein
MWGPLQTLSSTDVPTKPPGSRGATVCTSRKPIVLQTHAAAVARTISDMLFRRMYVSADSTVSDARPPVSSCRGSTTQ